MGISNLNYGTAVSLISGSSDVGIEPALRDAFGNLRTSSTHILFSSQLTDDNRSVEWDTKTVGTGSDTYVNARAAVDMDVAADGDRVLRQTKEYFLYRAGHGQLVVCTFSNGTANANVKKRVGYYDDDDGLFFENDAGTNKFVIRSSTSGSPVERTFSQSEWNIDKLDGTGASGITLNEDNATILFLDLEWLGAGNVRFGFFFQGQPVIAHEECHACQFPDVYMQRAMLPLRYEIVASGAATDTFTQICSSLSREGGDEDEGYQYCYCSFNEGLTATTTRRTIVSARLKPSRVKNSIVPTGYKILNRGNQPILVNLLINPTVTGSHTFADWGIVGQRSVSQLAVTAPGHIVSSNFIPAALGQTDTAASTTFKSIPPVGADPDGTPYIVSLAVTSLSGTQALDGAIDILELF